MDRLTKLRNDTLIELDNGVAAILEDCAIAAANMTKDQIIVMLATIASLLREKSAIRALDELNG